MTTPPSEAIRAFQARFCGGACTCPVGSPTMAACMMAKLNGAPKA